MQVEELKRKSPTVSTEASPLKIRKIPQTNGRFINAMISQWAKSSGAKIPLTPALSNREGGGTPELQMQLKEEVTKNETLKKKYQNAEERITSLSKSLDAEMNIRDEITEKLDATWQSIDTITTYCNYISDSLIAFQQHRSNLSTMYDNIIAGQSMALEKLKEQLSVAKHKYLEQENMVTETLGKYTAYEMRMQELMLANNGLKEQLQGFEEKFLLEKNHLMNNHTEEKLKLIKEQETIMAEQKTLKLRLEKQEDERRTIIEAFKQQENTISKLQNELVTYKNQTEALVLAKNELSVKYDSLMNTKNKLNEQLELTLQEAEQLRLQLSDGNIKENELTKRLSTLENKLGTEVTQCKKLRDYLLDTETKLKNEIARNKELEGMSQNEKIEGGAILNELHKKVGILQKEKEKLILEKDSIIHDMNNLKINLEEKHNKELATIKREYEANVSGLQKTITQSKNEIRKLSSQLEEARKETNNLKDKISETRDCNNQLKNQLKTVSVEVEKITTSETQLRNECNKYQSELRMMQQMQEDVQEDVQKGDEVESNTQANELARILTPIGDEYKMKENMAPVESILKSPKTIQFTFSSSPEDDLFDDAAVSNCDDRFEQLLTQINSTQISTTQTKSHKMLSLSEMMKKDTRATPADKKFFKTRKVVTGRTYGTKKEPKKKTCYRK